MRQLPVFACLLLRLRTCGQNGYLRHCRPPGRLLDRLQQLQLAGQLYLLVVDARA